MGHTRKRLTLALLSAAGLAVVAGCVDEKVVFRDRELFEEPLTAANSFLGYTDHATKLTVCGNCHIEKQGLWEETGHAQAWDGLQATGAAQEVCEGCHTVGQNGNITAEPGGYQTTGEQRYEDVQCEACHGPGLTHVDNPTDATVPLAPVDVAIDAPLGCGQCHSDTHHPFVEEWAQSAHGSPNAYPAGRADCESCHTGEGALEAFGVNTNYLEQADVEDNTASNLAITCSVCHNPHGGENEHQLRFSLSARSVDQNLCMKCHQKRAIPDPTSNRAPHSPQGPLLLGQEVGWQPPGFLFSDQQIASTHGSEANEKLCATCHVNAFEVTDPESGDFVFSATGHLFKPIPCLDAEGIPTADDSCGMNTTERTFQSCTAAGCHGSEDAALAAMLVAQQRIEDLVAELDALVAMVPPEEFDTSDERFTVGEGAKFNAALGAIESSAVHNPFLTEALLTASINAVQDTYGLPMLSPGLELSNVMWELSKGGN